MNFTFAHTNLNVFNLERSLAFYKEALGLTVLREAGPADGSFKLCFLGDGKSEYQLELTYLSERTEPYELGDNETHICFKVDDYAAAHELHEKMGCICFENTHMALYFIEDPDGYWIEIVPAKR